MNSKMEKVPKSTVSFLDAPKHKLKLMLVKFEKASICIYNILIFSVGGQTNPGGSRPVVAEIIWWQPCLHTSTTKNSAEQQHATLPPDMSGGRSGAQLGIAGGPARAEPQRQRAAVRSRSGLLGLCRVRGRLRGTRLLPGPSGEPPKHPWLPCNCPLSPSPSPSSR